MLVASCDGKVHCRTKVPPLGKMVSRVRYAGALLKLQIASAPLDRHQIRVYTYIMNTKFVCTCTTVRHAAQTLTAVYDRVLASSGLKITQYMLLRSILSGETEKSITELAQELGSDRSTTGRNLRVVALLDRCRVHSYSNPCQEIFVQFTALVERLIRHATHNHSVYYRGTFDSSFVGAIHHRDWQRLRGSQCAHYCHIARWERRLRRVRTFPSKHWRVPRNSACGCSWLH